MVTRDSKHADSRAKAGLGSFTLVRRDFIKTAAGAGGMWIVYRALPQLAAAPLPVSGPNSGWSGPPGKARYRIDGIAKVTGQKIYARDFRSRDIEGWPVNERCACILRTPVAGRTLESINLDVLPADLKPIKVVTGEDLERDQIIFPGSDEMPGGKIKGLVVPKGAAPDFLGQPVAILVFENFRIFREARRLLEFRDDILKFGPHIQAHALMQTVPYSAAFPRGMVKRRSLRYSQRRLRHNPLRSLAVPPGSPSYAPPTYLTRYADSSGEKFSQVLDGYSDPYGNSTPADQEAAAWRRKIQEELGANGWKVFKEEYETQEIDPLFMEPESGLAWFDREHNALQLVLGTQSPDESIADAVDMFSNPQCPMKVGTIYLNSCYPGGGFGGRDISTFPTLLCIAAAYSDGPVRIANDRFEQFQSGLKQLGARMTQSLAVDSQGAFQAVVGDYKLQAGGRNNYSQWVAQLAGYCGGGGYAIPKVSLDATAIASTGVIAGSMRGFGGPQAAFALESLIDEIALALNVDPILLREKNALAQGGYTVTGYQVTQSLRLTEICRLARAHPLWANRAKNRRERTKGETLYGVGFALTNLAYGTGCDGTLAAVELDRNGNITVTTNCVDMGNGSATALAISTARWLGANAARIQMGNPTPFSGLDLSDDPGTGGDDWSNPRWTPSFSMSSSASITAFQQVHAVEQASRALLATCLLPAARSLWNLPRNQDLDENQIRWENGSLTAPDKEPLPMVRLAREVFESAGTAGAMVHAIYQGRWVSSSFAVNGLPYRGEIDGLATRQATSAKWTSHDRSNVDPPPPTSGNNGRSLFSPSGTLAAVEVNRTSGETKVVAIQSFLESGRVVQPDLLMGQFYGGVAMGIGFALLEYLPHTLGGPGEGNWNMNRYHVALWRDVPINNVNLQVLDPVSADDPPRGIAEAVLSPVAPAIANAVADATGRRFRSLPITPTKIAEALRR